MLKYYSGSCIGSVCDSSSSSSPPFSTSTEYDDVFYHSVSSGSDNTVVSPADSPVSAVPHHSSAIHAALHHISQSLHHQQTHQITAASTDADRVSEYYLSSCDATTTVSTTEQQHYNSSTTATAVTPDYRTNYVSIYLLFLTYLSFISYYPTRYLSFAVRWSKNVWKICLSSHELQMLTEILQ